MKFIANLLVSLGVSAAGIGTQGCMSFIIDEPRLPNILIKK